MAHFGIYLYQGKDGFELNPNRGWIEIDLNLKNQLEFPISFLKKPLKTTQKEKDGSSRMKKNKNR